MSNWIEEQKEDRARFMEVTREHRMTILQDDGMYRNIKVQRPGSNAYMFNVTTIPGYLFFTGDMGAFTFSRLPDMFQFHRIKWDGDPPTIDYHYWAEKAVAVDKNGGLDEFDEASFQSSLKDAFEGWGFTGDHERDASWAAIKNDLDMMHPSNSDHAIHKVMDWKCPITGQQFDDFYEWGPFIKPSFRLRWACWAIASTIRDYDLGGDRIARQDAHSADILKGFHVIPRLGRVA